MFFEPNKVLSQDFLLNFVVSERGAGKTFSTLLNRVQHFLDTGKQFVYLRRTEIERDNSLTNLLTQLQGEGFFTDKVFKSFKDYITCDGKVICYCHAISTAYKHKSVSFFKVDCIVFDEFIDENGRYLKNEVEKFLSFVESIGRMREIQIIALGNLISKYNPYFTYFNVKMSESEFTRFKQKSIVIYNFKSEDYRKKKLETKFGRLISGTSYGNFMLNNDAIKDDYTLVDKLEGFKKFPKTNIIIEGKNVVVYDVVTDVGIMTLFQIRKQIAEIELINYDKMLVENAKLELIQKLPASRRISIALSKGLARFYDIQAKTLLTSFIF